jgi:hypothetical protein
MVQTNNIQARDACHIYHDGGLAEPTLQFKQQVRATGYDPRIRGMFSQ